MINTMCISFLTTSISIIDVDIDVGEGGGGDEYFIFELSPQKWPKTLTLKLFLSNGKIDYQDVPQLPVPLNDL